MVTSRPAQDPPGYAELQLRRLLLWAYRDMALEPQRRTASWSRFSTPAKRRKWLPPFDVCCPVCGSLQGQRCKTRKTGRTTDTHHERHEASWKWRAFNAIVRT